MVVGERCDAGWTTAAAAILKKGLGAIATGGVFAGLDHALEKSPPQAGAVQIFTGKIQHDGLDDDGSNHTIVIILASSIGVFVLVIIGFCSMFFIILLKKVLRPNATNNDIEMQPLS